MILIQLVELTYFINRTNFELSRFLAAIKDGDFSINFGRKKQNKSFRTLYSSFTQLIETLKELETEKAAQLHFLDRLVNQIEFGIISFDESGKISLINNQALSLLEIPKISNWRKINNPNTKILETLSKSQEGKNQLIETYIGNQSRYFSVNITSIIIRESRYKIVSFQDIKSEIQQKEIEAWHKLIRILTHEIMNSVTPFVSLTETIQLILQNENKKPKSVEELNPENILDINQAIDTIHERSQGILKFVQDYRKLTKIPKPAYEKIDLTAIITSISKLMEAELTKRRIEIKFDTNDYTFNLDRNLIEQVLINLIKNSMEAIIGTNSPKISVTTSESNEHIFINVSDNGPGVPANKIDRIFIPFYTTKKDGSGIGLSISRQIMNLHGGHLEIKSEPFKQTTFSLVFPIKALS